MRGSRQIFGGVKESCQNSSEVARKIFVCLTVPLQFFLLKIHEDQKKISSSWNPLNRGDTDLSDTKQTYKIVVGVASTKKSSIYLIRHPFFK